MPHHLLGAAALALGIALSGAAPLAAQRTDSLPAPRVMASIVVVASQGRASRALVVQNARLRRELARFDERVVALQLHLDSLKTHAEALARDRAYFEAATAQARLRRTQIEQRLRELEARSAPGADSTIATP
jgi:hypothetical protein